jgi:hypothetical protein
VAGGSYKKCKRLEASHSSELPVIIFRALPRSGIVRISCRGPICSEVRRLAIEKYTAHFRNLVLACQPEQFHQGFCKHFPSHGFRHLASVEELVVAGDVFFEL